MSLGARHLTDTLGVTCRGLRGRAELIGVVEEGAVTALAKRPARVAASEKIFGRGELKHILRYVVRPRPASGLKRSRHRLRRRLGLPRFQRHRGRRGMRYLE